MRTHTLLTVFFTFIVCGAPAYAQSSYGIERGTGKVICTGDADSAAAETDPSYAISAMWDQMVLGKVANDACGPDLTPIDGGTWAETKPFAGADAEGRTADFRMYVLSDAYSWRMGSHRHIEEDGRLVQFSEVLETPQFYERFCSAKAVMSVGASSYGGGRAYNQALAMRRSKTVTGALNGPRERCTTTQIPILHALSLGQATSPNTCSQANCSALQRRLIIVAVEDLTLGVNLKQALRRGLNEKASLPDFDVADYDQFIVEAY